MCVLLCCSPLDELIDLLGGVERVAEMTGRQARIVRQGNGKLAYEMRDARGSGATLESINNLEVSKGTVQGYHIGLWPSATCTVHIGAQYSAIAAQHSVVQPWHMK